VLRPLTETAIKALLMLVALAAMVFSLPLLTLAFAGRGRIHLAFFYLVQVRVSHPVLPSLDDLVLHTQLIEE
jgi:hypothetical protein